MSLTTPRTVVTAGASMFADALVRQAVDVVPVDWQPPVVDPARLAAVMADPRRPGANAEAQHRPGQQVVQRRVVRDVLRLGVLVREDGVHVVVERRQPPLGEQGQPVVGVRALVGIGERLDRDDDQPGQQRYERHCPDHAESGLQRHSLDRVAQPDERVVPHGLRRRGRGDGRRGHGGTQLHSATVPLRMATHQGPWRR